jgi:hypothetical protein
MRKITEVVLERCKTCDDFSANSEGGDAVRNALFRVGDYLKNRLSQMLQRRLLGFFKLCKVSVNLSARHISILALPGAMVNGNLGDWVS